MRWKRQTPVIEWSPEAQLREQAHRRLGVDKADLSRFARPQAGTWTLIQELALRTLDERRIATDYLADDDDNQILYDYAEGLAVNVVSAIDSVLYKRFWSSRRYNESLRTIQGLCDKLVTALSRDEDGLVDQHRLVAATSARQLLAVVSSMHEPSVDEISKSFGRSTSSLYQAVQFVVWVLPNEYQARYREEFRMELCDLAAGRFSWWRQTKHLVRLLSRVYQLRLALSNSPTTDVATREQQL
jgi:hypothetical protein